MSRTRDSERGDLLREMARSPLDVLIVGGGIVGAGIARDAAMRGLRTALVEQHDFAFGTSSRSSRLLHGGLRYLAQGRIGLVREASLEKRIIHTIAPHLAAPLAFVFPTYQGMPWAPWARWKLRIGVKLYDGLCGGQNLGRSAGLDAAAMAARLPGIRREGLTGGVRYFDGLTHDARLVLDTLRSAERAGGMLANYCRFDDAERGAGFWRCALTDRLTGRAYEVRALNVVNAAGPWAGRLRHSAVRLRLTKGVHLVVDGERLPVPDAVVMTEGSRILFAIPWGSRVILGTTDTDYAGEIEDVRTEREDVDYILGVVNAAFPRAELAANDVVRTWAGLRPLLADGSGSPSDISRAHEIRSPRPGWWDVAGGKLTTYRLMAEQTVDRIEDHLGRSRSPCRTATEPLVREDEAAGISGILPPPVTPQAVEHYCRREWAVHLDDVMVRRAGWHYDLRDPAPVAEQVAAWMAGVLGWDPATRERELGRYLEKGSGFRV